MPKRDYYDVLGISRSSSDKEIRNAYRKLARKSHPDLHPGDRAAEARFKEVSEAYEVLVDPEKRKKYDRFGHNWQQVEAAERAGAGAGGFGGHRTQRGRTVDFGGSTGSDDIGDLFEQLFGGVGGGRTRRNGPVRGEDVDRPLSVSLEDAFSGTNRDIKVQQAAGGLQTLQVKIPAGVVTGSRIRIAGKGSPGLAGGSAGDLYLVITVQPDPRFRRESDDLHTVIEVPLHLAVLGGEVFVPTPKGSRLALRLPPETQNGQRFRLAGQGMPHLGGTTRGDLFAEVKVTLPTGLSQRERELFSELATLRQG
jgi:DnaJ-class molecular chaperone